MLTSSADLKYFRLQNITQVTSQFFERHFITKKNFSIIDLKSTLISISITTNLIIHIIIAIQSDTRFNFFLYLLIVIHSVTLILKYKYSELGHQHIILHTCQYQYEIVQINRLQISFWRFRFYRTHYLISQVKQFFFICFYCQKKNTCFVIVKPYQNVIGTY